ncbi:MAG: hypothetical protein H7X89_10855, partial [Rhizobiales bacterium]|nr:hypothetical protein [Hyphomicrobiales bacterium]
AAHLEAVRSLSSAASLRLQVLKEELAGIVAASPEAREAFELALAPGDSPRLWIDLNTSVVMEPDPKTYRLVQQGGGNLNIVLETPDRAAMVQQVKLIMAHGMIGRRRRAGGLRLKDDLGRRYSGALLILTGLSGFFLGALSFLGAAICLEILSF